MTSTQRGQTLAQARKEAGWRRLNCWLNPDQAAQLEALRNGRSDQAVIAELLRALSAAAQSAVSA
jgi:hypothetical protein